MNAPSISQTNWTSLSIFGQDMTTSVLRVVGFALLIPAALYIAAMALGAMTDPGENSYRFWIACAVMVAGIALACVAEWLDGRPVRPQLRRGFEIVLKRKPRR
jgi:hypothetical protein